jgi:hypothetical protein
LISKRRKRRKMATGQTEERRRRREEQEEQRGVRRKAAKAHKGNPTSVGAHTPFPLPLSALPLSFALFFPCLFSVFQPFLKRLFSAPKQNRPERHRREGFQELLDKPTVTALALAAGRLAMMQHRDEFDAAGTAL